MLGVLSVRVPYGSVGGIDGAVLTNGREIWLLKETKEVKAAATALKSNAWELGSCSLRVAPSLLGRDAA